MRRAFSLLLVCVFPVAAMVGAACAAGTDQATVAAGSGAATTGTATNSGASSATSASGAAGATSTGSFMFDAGDDGNTMCPTYKSCAMQGADCGQTADGCGGILDCG